MPNDLKRVLVRCFAESARELDEVAVVFMNVMADISGRKVGRLFVLSDSDDFQMSLLQRRVEWIGLELCPYTYGREALGEIKVVGPQELSEINRDAGGLEPAVCIADYSGDRSFTDWVRSLNQHLN